MPCRGRLIDQCETLTIIQLIDYIRHIGAAQSMRPDPINWGFVNSCVLTVTAAVLLCEPWRGDEGCKGLEEAHIYRCTLPRSPVSCSAVVFTGVPDNMLSFYCLFNSGVSSVPFVAVGPSEV